MCFVKTKYEKKHSYLFIINISLSFTEASSIDEASVKDSEIFIMVIYIVL